MNPLFHQRLKVHGFFFGKLIGNAVIGIYYEGYPNFPLSVALKSVSLLNHDWNVFLKMRKIKPVMIICSGERVEKGDVLFRLFQP